MVSIVSYEEKTGFADVQFLAPLESTSPRPLTARPFYSPSAKPLTSALSRVTPSQAVVNRCTNKSPSQQKTKFLAHLSTRTTTRQLANVPPTQTRTFGTYLRAMKLPHPPDPLAQNSIFVWCFPGLMYMGQGPIMICLGMP